MADDLDAARAKHRHNQMMIDRIKGVPATPSTSESDADPRNPSVISPAPSPVEGEERFAMTLEPSNPLDAAIQALLMNGHRVERAEGIIPGLYHVDGGAEITTNQLIDYARQRGYLPSA